MPEVNAPATRTYEHCREWVRLGHEITVITCVPNFPQGKVFEGYKNKLYQVEFIDGIRVIRVWSYISANKGFLKRVLDFVSYAIMAIIVGLFQKFDLIIGTSPQFFTAVSARVLSFFKRKPWVMEVRDLWPESIAAVGAMKKESTAYKLLSKVEAGLYRSASKVIVVTKSFKKYIDSCLASDPKKPKVFVVTNGVDKSKFAPMDKDFELMDTLGLKNKFIIGYIGTHGMAHALDFVIKTASKIENKKIHFILQGDGSEKQKLMKIAKDLKVDNVHFLPFVSKQEIKRYISILDVALVNLKKSDTFKTVIPSKIFENACMLKPILLGVEGESKEIIEDYNAGLCYEPENEEDFLSKINLIQDPIKYKEYQNGCRNLSNNYDRQRLAENMIDYLKQEN